MSHNICTFFDILLIIAANVIKSNDYSDFITRFVRPANFSYSLERSKSHLRKVMRKCGKAAHLRKVRNSEYVSWEMTEAILGKTSSVPANTKWIFLGGKQSC